jgi:hypothetical protein
LARRKQDVESHRAKTLKKVSLLREFNDVLKIESATAKQNILSILDSQEFKDTVNEFRPLLRLLFECYRGYCKHPLNIPLDSIDFNSFFLFCIDFSVIPRNVKPTDLRTILVVIERLNFKVNEEQGVTYLNFDEFIEAIFVVSYSQVLVPSQHPLDSYTVAEIYAKLEQIEEDEDEKVRKLENGMKSSTSPDALKDVETKSTKSKQGKAAVKQKDENEEDEMQEPKPEGENSVEPIQIEEAAPENSSQTDPLPAISSRTALSKQPSKKQLSPIPKKPQRQQPKKLSKSPRVRHTTSQGDGLSGGARVIKNDPTYWQKGISHLREFLQGLNIPNNKVAVSKLVEERRKKYKLIQDRYWEGRDWCDCRFGEECKAKGV